MAATSPPPSSSNVGIKTSVIPRQDSLPRHGCCTCTARRPCPRGGRRRRRRWRRRRRQRRCHPAGDGRRLAAAGAAPGGAVRGVRAAARAGVLRAGGVRASAARVRRQPRPRRGAPGARPHRAPRRHPLLRPHPGGVRGALNWPRRQRRRRPEAVHTGDAIRRAGHGGGGGQPPRQLRLARQGRRHRRQDAGHVRLLLGLQHHRRRRGRQLPRHWQPPQPQRTAARRLRPHVRRGEEDGVRQRLRRRADDERLRLPDELRRADGAGRVPVHGRAGDLPFRRQQGRRARGQLHRRRAGVAGGQRRQRRADAGGAGQARPARRGSERGVHADVRGRGVVPAGVPAGVGEPRRAPRRLRRARVLGAAVGLPPLLDHQELVGEDVGGERLLQALPRPQRLRRRHHGLRRRRRATATAVIDR